MLLVEYGRPYGYGNLKWQYGSWWVVDVMAGKGTRKGTGKDILYGLIDEAREKMIPHLRLGTRYENLTMLFCALKCGFELEGTDRDGYVLRRDVCTTT